jgi:hypothetical protein
MTQPLRGYGLTSQFRAHRPTRRLYDDGNTWPKSYLIEEKQVTKETWGLELTRYVLFKTLKCLTKKGA